MYELYIANKNYSSWSLRPWVLMRHLDIPFREHLVPFVGQGRANYAQFRKISPSAKVPALVDGALTVWDSLAIAEYLAERHAGVWPQDAAARAFARCSTAEMHSGFAALRSTCSMNIGVRVRLARRSPELDDDLARLAELFAEGLSRFGGPFLAGDVFTAADAFYCPVATRIQTYDLPLPTEGMRYVATLLALPAMQEWTADALAEPQRIAHYEALARAAGDWVADLRAGT